MNEAFRVLDLPYRYTRAGGASIDALDDRRDDAPLTLPEAA